MTRPVLFVAALVLAGTSVGVAQQKRVVTTADYDRAVKMLAPALNGLVVGDSVNADLAAGRPLLVRPHDADRHGERRHRPGEEDARGGGDAARRRASCARRRRGGRGGRGRRRWSRRHGRGGGVTLSKTCGPNVTGTDRRAAAVDVARRHQGDLHLRLESLGEGRRDRPGAPADDRRREGLRLRDEQRRLGDERRTGAVLVTRRQEDRHAAAGRAQGRRHVPGRDAGQRRPSGAARVEVSAPRRSRRRDDQPRRHRRRDRQDDAPADGAGLPPRDVGRQHRHGRIPVEPGRIEARVRVDRSVPQELHRQARRHDDRRSQNALHRNREDARADARAVADPLGHRTKSSGIRSATAPRRCISTTSRPAS